MPTPRVPLHLALVLASLLIAALCSATTAHAQTRATGKIVIYQASSILNVEKLVTGEAPTAARVFDQPLYGCIEIPRNSLLGQGGHNLLNLTNATIEAFLGQGCQGLPAASLLGFPPSNLSPPNTGIHIDLANSLRVRAPDPASSIFGGGVTVPVSIFTGLPSGPTPIPDAPLQFMPTPDGYLGADPNPGIGKCKPINPLVHNVYNASATNWVYLWTDPPVPVIGGCNLKAFAVPPGYIQHLVASTVFAYSVSPVGPSTRAATASVRAACRQQVGRSASKRVKARARTRAATCRKAMMWSKRSTASASRR